jgi:probable F420-dependent oxidoreductase
MEFGIAFKGEIEPKRTIAIVRQCEAAGFDYCWFFDSHILWADPYPKIAQCMAHTETMRFGPLVTNPKVRDWSVAASMFATLAKVSGGRFDIAVGRGDSSMRVMGKTPGTIAYTSEFCEAMRKMNAGESYQYDECPEPVFMDWVDNYDMPIWVAAYGPKALKMAGEVGDGLVVQLADPGLCQWFSEQSIAAGKAAGRDMSNYRVLSCAPVWIGDKKTGVAQTKWFPALVGNHVADIVEKYGKESALVPKSLTDYIENRRAGGAGGDAYNYRQHADKDSDNTYFVTPEITESFGILGTVEEHVEKLKQLEAAGVTQFTIYLTNGSEEKIVAEYGEHVIPNFR